MFRQLRDRAEARSTPGTLHNYVMVSEISGRDHADMNLYSYYLFYAFVRLDCGLTYFQSS